MIALRSWTNDDCWLLHATLGNPAMMEHLGGVESAEQIERRHERFVRGHDMFTVGRRCRRRIDRFLADDLAR
jgi:hypothetical protein